VGPGHEDEFRKLGIREEVWPLLQKLNIQSGDQLREIKATKLLNDLGGMRKKMKLESMPAVTLSEIEGWQRPTP
jgi:lysyl-tRNA synthetase class 2